MIGNFSDQSLINDFDSTMLESMPYITAFVKETLRLYPAVAYGLFQAGKDDIIPLSRPVAMEDGKLTKYVHIAKDQRVVSIILYK